MARLDTLLKGRERYGPANRCIYCGAVDLPLTDEHILPDGLGGTHILMKASCRKCADIINRDFESYVLRVLLGPYREKFEIRSRKSAKKKRSRPPQKLVLNKRDGSVVTVYPEKEDLPPILFLPILDNPGLLTGKLGNKLMWGMFQFPWQMRKYLQHWDAISVQTPPIDSVKFARWIAKVAHAHAIPTVGDVFEPALPRIILGDTQDILDWVGGIPEENERKQPGYLLGTGITQDATGTTVAVSLVRVFAQYGAPLYLVVLGKLTGEWPITGSDDPAIVSRYIPDTKRGWRG